MTSEPIAPEDPRLDRLVQFDERSWEFPIRAIIPTLAPQRSYTWSCHTYLDQGMEGACVGFSVAHEIAARPKPLPASKDMARNIYLEAQKIDEWPGESYAGTSVLAGMKTASKMGYFNEYRWAFGIDDLIMAIGYKGPAVLGINWYEGMQQADSDGFIHVFGKIRGGHAILCNGVNVKKRYFRLHNSWGQDWGQSGDTFISFEDLDRLLHEQGEACVPVIRTVGSIA